MYFKNNETQELPKTKIIHAFLRDIMAELIPKKIFDSEINTKIDTKISIKVFLLKINYN